MDYITDVTTVDVEGVKTTHKVESAEHTSSIILSNMSEMIEDTAFV